MSKRADIGTTRNLGHSTCESWRTDGLSETYRQTFQLALLDWYRQNGRDYLWRSQTDPYKILVAEIMLQQTNADKVEPIYAGFIEKYPDVNSLVSSDLQDLKATLKPLGLEYRVVRLKKIAERLVAEHGGEVPSTKEVLLALPGIGLYVCNAVLCFAFSKRVALVDVNVIRLYRRVFDFRSHKSRPREDREVWAFATQMLPETNFKEYNLALLDFTAGICTLKRPNCTCCPITGICLCYTEGALTNGN